MADIRGTTSGNTLDSADGVTSGDDEIYGRGGDDVVFGLGGDDFIADGAWSGGPARTPFNAFLHGFSTWSSGGDDEFHGGSGDDTLIGDGGDDTLFGDGDDDTLQGGQGNDTLDGGSGNDILIDDTGNEVIRGGTGTDTVRYNISGSSDAEPTDSEPLFPVGVKGVFVDMETGRSGFAFDDPADNRIFDVRYDSAEIFELGSRNDEFHGNNASQTIRGQGGDDVLEGRGGGDTLDGGTGSDTASYESAPSAVFVTLRFGDINIISGASDELGDSLISIENLTGSRFDDGLTGGDGANILKGLNGNDFLDGRGGADRLDGGGNTDTADYQASNAAINISTDGTAGSGGFAAGDRLTSIENIIGSSFNDVISGHSNAINNVFEGRGGNDNLFGVAGDDILAGGTGINLIDGGTSVDTVSYRDIAGPVSVSLQDFGNGGSASATNLSDTIFGVENVDGTDAGDFVLADANANRLRGFGGNDDLRGIGGEDVLDGGDGDDILMGGTSGDQLLGGKGTDTASYRLSEKPVQVNLATGETVGGEAAGDTLSSIENLIGSSFADRLVGNAFANEFSGLNGNDTLIGGAGADRFAGGSGTDTVSYETSSSPIILDLANPVVNTGDAGGDTFDSIERFIGTGGADIMFGDDGNNELLGAGGADFLFGRWGDDTLRGGGASDTLDGGGWNDQLFGDDADDTLVGGAGSDLLNGGAGRDTASYSTAPGRIVVDLNDPTQNRGDAEGDSFVSIEVITGSTADDIIRGANGLAMTLIGGDGADELVGGNLDDVLEGGLKDDVLTGGIGADALLGGDGIDTASYENSIRSVVIDLRPGGSLTGGDAVGDTFSSIEVFRGTNFSDVFIGNGQDLTFQGLGSGDTFIGSAGREVFDGGPGDDVVTYALSADAITLDLFDRTQDTGDVVGDRFLSIAAINGTALEDRLSGNDEANHFQGLSDDDVIDGRAGNDILSGDGGDDTLIGGQGADSMAGGDGIDIASYLQSTGVTVALDGTLTATGDAVGDSMEEIENLLGSRTDANRLRGNGGVNEITGGDARDTLEGQGGDDVLHGGKDVDRLFGGGNNDRLFGEAGDDILSGGSNRDTLIGDAGNDTLTGGTDLDRFQFTTREFGRDTVTDWQGGTDKLRTNLADDLSDFTVTGNGTTEVVLTLLSDVDSVIVLQAASAFTITNTDFEFV
ncbi:calcium-binding protein [Oleomonas cavernae]|uniref:Calcium-binding protein n=1 Tax=Oleomonas cavernae TaxID=2320859 RepID=A0A418W8D0_9PROT|nr:calcium-binding protein [Oleomonas cavernae]RJF86255.1 calcium-binding protein [Oleomonas cavernae]